MKRVLGLAAGAILWFGCTGKYVRQTTDEVVKPTEERLQRGEYLVNQVAGCGSCHTTRNGPFATTGEDTTQFLGGGNVMEEPAFDAKLWVPNITSDVETGVGAWTDDELMRAIRDGISRDGRLQVPMMPFPSYRFMSDEDVRAVVAYIRSVPKVKQTKPRQEHQLPFLMGFLVNRGMMHQAPTKDVPPVDRSDKLKLGAYIARLGDCWNCHSMGSMGARAEDDRWFGGSDVPFETRDIGKSWASNLTPDVETGTGKYSADQLKAAIREGKRLDGKAMAPPMALFMPYLSGLTDEDLDALVAYLQSLPPVKHKVPERELLPEGKKLVGET